MTCQYTQKRCAGCTCQPFCEAVFLVTFPSCNPARAAATGMLQDSRTEPDGDEIPLCVDCVAWWEANHPGAILRVRPVDGMPAKRVLNPRQEQETAR